MEKQEQVEYGLICGRRDLVKRLPPHPLGHLLAFLLFVLVRVSVRRVVLYVPPPAVLADDPDGRPYAASRLVLAMWVGPFVVEHYRVA